jgi:uncharacterized protein YbaP (TraB family)
MPRFFSLRLLRAAGVLGLAAGTLAYAASARAQDGSRTAPTATMWRVQNGANLGYLVGSIHLLSSEYYPLADVIERALGASSTLVGEVHPDEFGGANAPRMLSKALLADGATLETSISPETWKLLRQRLDTSGIPVAVFQRMKPWMAALSLMALEIQRDGFSPELGVDKHLFDRARSAGKSLQGLETLDDQIEIFDGMSLSLQDQFIREMLRDSDTQLSNVKTLARAWKIGDIATLERLLVAELRSAPELYQRLLIDRNRAWLPRVEACFARQSPCFIVVGAAHLVGPDGLVAMLRAKGYTVEQE